jgi:S1-C subfamily serine protease
METGRRLGWVTLLCALAMAGAAGTSGCERIPKTDNASPESRLVLTPDNAPATPAPAPPSTDTKGPENGGQALTLRDGFAPIVERVGAAVVNVSAVRKTRGQGSDPSFGNPLFRDFFGDDLGRQMPRPPEQAL